MRSFVKSRAADRPAVFKKLAGQQGKNAAGRTAFADFVIGIAGGKTERLSCVFMLLRRQSRTSMLAKMTLRTFIGVNPRI